MMWWTKTILLAVWYAMLLLGGAYVLAYVMNPMMWPWIYP